jgi:hypothetical protein
VTTGQLWGQNTPLPAGNVPQVHDYLPSSPGLVRRSYVTFEHGTMAHLYQRTFKLEGAMSLCGKVGGIRQNYAAVKDRATCARCWRRLKRAKG